MLFTSRAFLTAAVLLISLRQAHAYLDPGTGSIILQALVGTVAAGLVAGRLYWDKVRRFLSPSKHGKLPADDHTPRNDE
jgi:hypothetical protein